MPMHIRILTLGTALFSILAVLILALTLFGKFSQHHQTASPNTIASAGSEHFKDPNGPWPGGKLWLGTRPAPANAADAEQPPVAIAIDQASGQDI